MNLGQRKQIFISVATGILLFVVVFVFLNVSLQAARAAPTDLFITPVVGGGGCSQTHPCDLQTALSTADDGDNLYLAGGAYTGSGGAVVTMTHNIALYGGWDGASSGPVNHDGTLHPTTLDGEGLRRVVYVNVGITPTLDGFIITGGNATGLGGGMFAGSEAGGGIYSLNASPVIQNNLIIHNVASTLPGVRALGGGLYINGDSNYAIVRHNQIISNTAGIGIGQGDGGGLFVNGVADVLNNSFRENVACQNCDYGSGGGGYIGWSTSEIVIAGNIFENNQAQQGGAIALVWSAVQISGNTIIENTATKFGGGLYSTYDKGSNIHSNVFMSNTATGFGGGLRIYITYGPEDTRLVNNIIAHNQAPLTGGGFVADSDWILSAITVNHNTIVSNGTGIRIGQNMTATLANNIVANHTLGIAVTDPSGNVFADHTLLWDNADDGIRGTSPVDGDPAFVNPDMNNFHIGPASAAIDSGVIAGVSTDFDGQTRPIGAGYDIGADEFSYNIYISVVSRNFQP